MSRVWVATHRYEQLLRAFSEVRTALDGLDPTARWAISAELDDWAEATRLLMEHLERVVTVGAETDGAPVDA